MFNANLYRVSINYCSYMSWPQFLSIVKEHISFLMCAVYVSTYLACQSNN